jgi:hypothetical protein
MIRPHMGSLVEVTHLTEFNDPLAETCRAERSQFLIEDLTVVDYFLLGMQQKQVGGVSAQVRF